MDAASPAADGSNGSPTARSLEHVKLHRRRFPLDGQLFTLFCVRPTEPERFQVTRSAGSASASTFDIVASAGGNRLLGVLCWAMAFQTHEPAVVVIGDPLVLAGADGSPGAPIVVVNAALATPGVAGFEELRVALASEIESQGTVKLSTRGLARALHDPPAFDAAQAEAGVKPGSHRTRRWVDLIGGVVVLAAPPGVLRSIAVDRASAPSVSESFPVVSRHQTSPERRVPTDEASPL